ncbi:SLC13 family permease [Vibrio porteresiae]|uniref:SLC13 family permease n=1 Tax=Vibrio porteresiae DSM 19223 TaxID=1123496 RepID=A0ABZ0Q858_9VIBR|nr:SLC13 family permease [Vibrio porteresiae]WPC72362.1 SLC13 family permease [Vibrio porteresiae DSM 19223]
MPSLAVMSILGICFSIIIGFYKKTNVGILMIAFAFILSIIYNIPTKEILSGFSVKLFITMLGVTYLFSIMSGNGTLDIISKKIVNVVHNKKLLPVAMYLVGFILCAVGPGAIPVLAIVPVIAIPIAFQAKLNPIMLAIIGQCGVFGGRMTQITPEGVLVKDLMSSQQIENQMFPVWFSLFFTSVALAIACYIWYKGWKTEEDTAPSDHYVENTHMTWVHWTSLCALLLLIVCAVGFSLNVGLTAFVIGAALSAFGSGNENQAIKNIPWSVLILVSGVGLLMHIVLKSGGLDILTQSLASIMTATTASSVMVMTSAIMSFFSSGLGVVFPTLIPTCQGIIEQLGGHASAIELVAMVVVGGTVSGLSPVSTTGALIMSGIATNKEAEQTYTPSKMFVELFAWATFAMVISFVLAIVGFFSLIC